ncbi:MAG: hypothetical protein PHH00_02745 [Candidatus Nanoarchaeia archaeon]|nr:hypothetical protein [Candidatus Nanoarchaeia archaeon]
MEGGQEILYSEGQIQITYAPGRETYYVTIGDRTLILPHGTLEELARTPRNIFYSKLNAVDNNAGWIQEAERISNDQLQLAIVKARIAELESQLSGAYSQAREH